MNGKRQPISSGCKVPGLPTIERRASEFLPTARELSDPSLPQNQKSPAQKTPAKKAAPPKPKKRP